MWYCCAQFKGPQHCVFWLHFHSLGSGTIVCKKNHNTETDFLWLKQDINYYVISGTQNKYCGVRPEGTNPRSCFPMTWWMHRGDVILLFLVPVFFFIVNMENPERWIVGLKRQLGASRTVFVPRGCIITYRVNDCQSSKNCTKSENKLYDIM